MEQKTRRRIDYTAPELHRESWWMRIKNYLPVTNDKFIAQRKHRPDYLMVILMFSLSLIGLVILVSIAPAYSGGDSDIQTRFIAKQVGVLVIGLFAFFICSRIKLDIWRRISWYFLIFTLVANLLVWVFGILHLPIAPEINGATRWYALPFDFTLQVSELLKFALLMFIAGFLSQRIKDEKIDDWKTTLMPLGMLMGVSLFIVVGLQKDMGTGTTMVGLVMTQLIIAKLSWRRLVAILAGIAGVFVVFLFLQPYRLQRIWTMLGNEKATDHMNYHAEQAEIAIGSGGIFGRGLGKSIQAFGWLPEATTDSIFAVAGESFGFFGAIVLLIIFFSLLWRLLKISDYIQNTFLQLFVAGGFGWLATHVLVNISAMTGVLPLTGITLPFLSFGGTSLIVMMALMGVIFNISRYTGHRSNKVKEESYEDFGSRWRVGGARDSGSCGGSGIEAPTQKT